MYSATRNGASSRRALSSLLAFAAIATAVSMLAITPYRFGVADHALTIPFLKQWIDPTLFASDYVVNEKGHLYTALWPVLAYFIRMTGLSIETVFLAGYIIALYATFVAIGVFAREMAASTSAGLLAMFIAVFTKYELAGAATIDDVFLTRVLAVPLTLFAFTEVARRCYVGAGVLLGIAFVIHPLTAIYAGGMVGLLALFAAISGREREIVPGIGAFLAIASPILLWKALDPVALPVIADPEWLAVLKLRSPHHVAALEWSPILYVATAALVAVVVACAPSIEERHGRLLKWLSFAGLAVCAFDIPFAELLPISAIVQLQLFRASAFLAYLAIVAYAGALLGAAKLALPVSGLATLWLAGFAVLYGAEGWPFALVALMVLIAAMATYRRMFDRAPAPELLALVLIGLLGGLAFGAARNRPPIRFSNLQPAAWLEVQRWARMATPKDAVFIVPPGHDGFRVESERTIYGDWKDGTQAFFNAEVGREWLKRMKRLGYRPEMPVRGLSGLDFLDDAYRRLDRDELVAIAGDVGSSKVYVVDFADSTRWTEDAAYRNEKYAVYGFAVSGPGTD